AGPARTRRRRRPPRVAPGPGRGRPPARAGRVGRAVGRPRRTRERAAPQRCEAIVEVIGDRGPSRALADALAFQTYILTSLGRIPEAAECGRRALAMARELDDPLGQVWATMGLANPPSSAPDLPDAPQLARHARP